MHRLQSFLESQPPHRSTPRPAAAVITSTLPPGPRSLHTIHSRSTTGAVIPVLPLHEGWEFRRTPATGIWQIWGSDDTLWSHFSADQSEASFDSPGWYRTRFPIRNPITNGRTILQLVTGRATTLWVGPILIGTRRAAHDCVFDITDAIARLAPAATRQGTPIAILCERPRKPHNGFTSKASLACLPALALDQLQIRPRTAPGRATQLSISGHLYNPTDRTAPVSLTIDILDSGSHLLHTTTCPVAIWSGIKEIASLRITSGTPTHCRVTLHTPEGDTQLEQSFARPHLLHVPHDQPTQSNALSWA